MSRKRTRRDLRTCAHCLRWNVEIVSSSKLCTECKRAGYRWCSSGQHVVRVENYGAARFECVACRRIESKQQKNRARGAEASPPPGFIRLQDLAKRLGYCRQQIGSQIRRGWLADHVWRRAGRRTVWYIRDMPSYPPWEDGRQCHKNTAEPDSNPYAERIGESSIGL